MSASEKNIQSDISILKLYTCLIQKQTWIILPSPCRTGTDFSRKAVSEQFRINLSTSGSA